MGFKSISNTVSIDKSKLTKITAELSQLNIEAVKIDIERIGFMLDMFKRKYKYSMTVPVISAVMSGDVVPIFTKSTNITSYMPGFMKAYNDNIRSFVNLSITSSIRLNAAGELGGSERTIFSLLQFGYILHGTFFKYDSIINNATLHNLTSMAYGKLFSKVMNKIFSTAHYPELYAKIMFMAMKFYYINLIEKPAGDRLNSMIFSNVNKIVPTKIVESRMGDVFDISDDVYADTTVFFKKISELDSVVSKATFNTFNSNWVLLYGSMGYFASEHPVYLWGNIATSVIGSNLNRGYENVLGELMFDVYNKLASVLI